MQVLQKRTDFTVEQCSLFETLTDTLTTPTSIAILDHGSLAYAADLRSQCLGAQMSTAKLGPFEVGQIVALANERDGLGFAARPSRRH